MMEWMGGKDKGVKPAAEEEEEEEDESSFFFFAVEVGWIS